MDLLGMQRTFTNNTPLNGIALELMLSLNLLLHMSAWPISTVSTVFGGDQLLDVNDLGLQHLDTVADQTQKVENAFVVARFQLVQIGLFDRKLKVAEYQQASQVGRFALMAGVAAQRLFQPVYFEQIGLTLLTRYQQESIAFDVFIGGRQIGDTAFQSNARLVYDIVFVSSSSLIRSEYLLFLSGSVCLSGDLAFFCLGIMEERRADFFCLRYSRMLNGCMSEPTDEAVSVPGGLETSAEYDSFRGLL
ncbi:hypothetical protein BpHYR1_044710 [Brachionus plicatilis]|uniref:Uncharacterized protein n=1 Tax=Brachionus plicatilis TaxID=10195 RepID=A0A3M7Q8L9_BRAPC|nr:hypothetical protein BpHYR1_044710 [Brachionus plicatilis]